MKAKKKEAGGRAKAPGRSRPTPSKSKGNPKAPGRKRGEK